MALDLEAIRGIAARVAASYSLEIWEVELRGTGGRSRMLRVYIDRPSGGVASSSGSGQADGTPAVGGVTHEDCVNVSRELGTILDVEDAVPGGTYLLEVSSPGLDRKLAKPADFERFVGSLVKLMTREPVNENRHFEGRLERFGEGRLVLSLEEKKEKGKGKKKRGRDARATAGETPALRVEIELSNVERAHLVPEI
ncbi:MAG TPA: ribosome maturation factor RimP [Terriglobales bacterium]|nr:ribosome maturation factor RimP [Terriglobales bacterium]